MEHVSGSSLLNTSVPPPQETRAKEHRGINPLLHVCNAGIHAERAGPHRLPVLWAVGGIARMVRVVVLWADDFHRPWRAFGDTTHGAELGTLLAAVNVDAR